MKNLTIELINDIIGDTTFKKFKKWIRGNYSNTEAKNIIEGLDKYSDFFENIEDCKLFLAKNYPQFYFPKQEYRLGMILQQPELYDMIFKNRKVDWRKITNRNNNWLIKFKNRPKNDKNECKIGIKEFNIYFILYKQSPQCIGLSSLFYDSIRNIKDKIDNNLFDKLLVKIHEIFYTMDSHFIDHLCELLILSYYLNNGFKLLNINYKLEYGTDIDFEMIDNNGEEILIEVENKHIESKPNDWIEFLKEHLTNKFKDKMKSSIDKKKRLIICQNLTGYYTEFNNDIVELFQNYPKNIKVNTNNFYYDTFAFFLEKDLNPVFISFTNKMALTHNNELIYNINLVKPIC